MQASQSPLANLFKAGFWLIMPASMKSRLSNCDSSPGMALCFCDCGVTSKTLIGFVLMRVGNNFLEAIKPGINRRGVLRRRSDECSFLGRQTTPAGLMAPPKARLSAPIRSMKKMQQGLCQSESCFFFAGISPTETPHLLKHSRISRLQTQYSWDDCKEDSAELVAVAYWLLTRATNVTPRFSRVPDKPLPLDRSLSQ